MYLYDTTCDSQTLRQTAVEVEIWEGYLLKNKSNISRTLCTYSLDNGPLQEAGDGKLIFRFTAFDWKKNIETLLRQNNIHFHIIGKLEIDPFGQLLKKRIYIASDDLETSDVLSTLEDAGYHVRATSSGKAILDGSFSGVDLFILDRKMPDMDGLKICSHLRLQQATQDTPVIIMSSQPRLAKEALLAGANDYIERPFHMHYLLNLVARLTNHQRWSGN